MTTLFLMHSFQNHYVTYVNLVNIERSSKITIIYGRLLWARTGSCLFSFQLYHTGLLTVGLYGKHSLAIGSVRIETGWWTVCWSLQQHTYIFIGMVFKCLSPSLDYKLHKGKFCVYLFCNHAQYLGFYEILVK